MWYVLVEMDSQLLRIALMIMCAAYLYILLCCRGLINESANELVCLSNAYRDGSY